MPNFKASISRHNQKLLKEEQTKNIQANQDPVCNCNPGPCPLITNNCTVDHVIYRATVKDENNKINTYTGLTRNTFKKRYNGHTYSFNHRGENSTTLSSHLWKLKDQNKNYEISWNIIDRAREFNPVNRKCRLCTKEKFYIIFQPEGATLNTRSELFTTCRHRLRLLLQNMYNTWGISISIRYRNLNQTTNSSFKKLSLKIVILLCRSYETICTTKYSYFCDLSEF